jgi:NAD(P)-dependent dehydrogenase (short-subunit alcohol dehydrogenase family)
MDIAIVTGAETSLGLRIVQTLVQQGYRVHGVGNNFSKVTYTDPQFKGHAIDLTDLDSVRSALERILADEQRLDCLIHAIDVTPGSALEKLPPGNLEAIVKIGLLGPVMMTRLALPNLLRFRGQLINIITGNKHGHPASAANALIEGGLREMNKALFDCGRDVGLRVTNCLLRQSTELSDASVSDEVLAQGRIHLGDVVHTIEQLIDSKTANVPEEIVLHPQLSSAAAEPLPKTPLPLDPYEVVVLPPKAYCPPEEPKIPTQQKQQVERTIPYTDEEMEDRIAAAIEDFEAHPERYERSTPERAKKSPQNGDSQQEDGPDKGKRRRRRRGGRNRKKKPPQGPETPKPQDKPEQNPEEKAKAQDRPERSKTPPAESAEQPDRTAKPKKKPAKASKSPDREKPPAKKPAKNASKKTAKTPDAAMPKKKVAKKAAKKVAAKKAAKKKAATKKAAKKAAGKPSKPPMPTRDTGGEPVLGRTGVSPG